MTIATSVNKVTGLGNGATTAFSYSFLMPAASNAIVTVTDTLGNQTVLNATQYSITGIGNPNGGTLNYPLSGSPMSAGQTITLQRVLPLQQLTSLVNQSGYYPAVVESAFDNLEMQIQQIYAATGGHAALQFPGVDAVTLNSILPAAAARANMLLSFDSSGNVISIAAAAQSATALTAQLAATNGSTLVGFIQAGTGAVSRTTQSKDRDVVSVMDFGAVGNGSTDDYLAFAAAWAYVKPRGGTLLIPPGDYLLNTQWLVDVDLTLPHQYEIIGYGAQLFAGAAVTGHAIKVFKGFNNFGVTIEGLQFNHRNNTTVNGCIQALGANNIRVVECSVEHHNTKANYSGIDIGPYTVGDPNTNGFWGLIDGFKTRQRSGSDGTNAAIGILLRGQANATKITNCEFTSLVDAIYITTDGGGVATGTANGVVIAENDFEGVTNAITLNNAPPAVSMITGLRVHGNRLESVTTFINCVGGATSNSNCPPNIYGNYLTVGSVTNYLYNPANQILFTYEPSISGVGARNYLGGPTDFQVIADGVGKNLVLSNLSGLSAWNGAHFVMGVYHIWVDGSSRLRIKSGVPSSDTDGIVVGTQT
jgi:hypothetical protein